ncbi:sensor histidine kinase [Carnobacterium gallinarum]|uniref:sensor histidine kinase n=1 Tax=Carnobacterium gallinarum TaxID=2749 RepID=UPI0005574B3D|nr:sensor histidine kinase [Carnobacterium gallinarum]
MNAFKFLKDQWILIVFWFFGLLILNLVLILDPNQTFTTDNLVYVSLLLTVFFLFLLTGLYIYYSRWFRVIEEKREAGEDGLLSPLDAAMNEEQKFIQGYINDLLILHQKEMNRLSKNQQDQKDFVDSWVHEIKVPLAGTKLIIESVEDDISEKKYYQLESELKKINHYVEQVLYYSRLDSFSRDYLLHEYSLERIVNNIIRNNATYFIQNQLAFELTGDDQKILTDEKWLHFILEQIISNCIKYTPKGGKISIQISKNNLGVWLAITDTGIGIPEEDQRRIFDKGFTGFNGRNDTSHHSTGLGLYLAKNLGEKLGHQLFVESTVGKGTTFKILFPFLTYFNEENQESQFLTTD